LLNGAGNKLMVAHTKFLSFYDFLSEHSANQHNKLGRPLCERIYSSIGDVKAVIVMLCRNAAIFHFDKEYEIFLLPHFSTIPSHILEDTGYNNFKNRKKK